MKIKFTLPEISSYELSCEDAIMASSENITDSNTGYTITTGSTIDSANVANQYTRWKGMQNL